MRSCAQRTLVLFPRGAHALLPSLQVLRSMTMFQSEPQPGFLHPRGAGQAAFGKSTAQPPHVKMHRCHQPAPPPAAAQGQERPGWAAHHLTGPPGPGRPSPCLTRDSLCFEPTLTGTLRCVPPAAVLSCLGLGRLSWAPGSPYYAQSPMHRAWPSPSSPPPPVLALGKP